MSDSIIKEKLNIIYESICLVQNRFSKIDKADDFVLSEEGVLILDAIAIRLQVIGEALSVSDRLTKSEIESLRRSRSENFRRSAKIVFLHGNRELRRCKNTISALRNSCKAVSGGNFSIC